MVASTRHHAWADEDRRKLGLSFWQYLGDRLGLEGQAIPPLAALVAAKA